METYLEYAAVLLGVVYVLLASKGNKWCWPAGIAGSALYISINVTHHLFQDAILQVYYVLAGFYGWWKWTRKDRHEEQNIISYTLTQNLPLIAGGALLVPVFGYLFAQFGNALSYFDAAVTVFSFIATWMTAKKILQNWIFWIVIDALAAAMYAIKGLYPTTGLYVFYCIVCMYGYLEWQKQLRLQQSEATI
jgi:nicotinamide mononucleotide transporter